MTGFLRAAPHGEKSARRGGLGELHPGHSTRSVDDLVKAMVMSGISKSQVSRLCEGVDERAKTFLDRLIEDDWPCLWIDAT
jgi:putative transposase